MVLGRAALEVCRGDISQLCGHEPAGGGRIVRCLMSQRDRLSPGCRRFVAEAGPGPRSKFACAADARRLCASTLPGGGRIIACLNSKRDALSLDCARALDEAASVGR